MNVGAAAARAGLTVRAVRYYESVGLVVPARKHNGYRDYQPGEVRLLQEIRALTELGLSAEQTRPFRECLALGHAEADDCPASLAAYRDAIRLLSAQIEMLTQRREGLRARLEHAASRCMPSRRPREDDSMPDLNALPDDLPVPVDDGAADHLPGAVMPVITLAATNGERVELDQLGQGRSVLYFYSLTGRPGIDLPDGWDNIPGARGCTTEACDFRDHHADLLAAGVHTVQAVSSQDTDYQRELVERLHLPFAMLADPNFSLANALNLPTFTAAGQRLYRRLSLVVADGRIEHVFYPIFPPNQHAREVLAWLHANRA